MKLRKKQRGKKKSKMYLIEPPCLHNSQSQIDENDPLWVPELEELAESLIHEKRWVERTWA